LVSSASPPLADALVAASRVIARVLDGGSLSTALAASDGVSNSGHPALRAAVQDLSYTALREYGFVERIVAPLVTRTPTPILRALLYAAITELRERPGTVHAIVDQSVVAAGRLAGMQAKGFVNAVLRRYLREADRLVAEVEATEEGRWRHPQWWIDRVRRAYPDAWREVLAADNQHPPMTLRVNVRRTDRAGYLSRLQAGGIDARAVGEQGVRLAKPVRVDIVPGFRDGLVSVQDAGAQLAAPLLDVKDGMRVLDACAAPGGKAAHLLELASLDLTALDTDPVRLGRVHENFERLGLVGRILVGDARDPARWWDGRPYQRALADVPCSASGVVRRHPDIRWLRREDDLARFGQTQAQLLDALWQVLAPGGKLLYATCSVFAEENAAQVDGFLARRPDASRVPIEGLAAGPLVPDEDHDGFFYALLKKSD